VNSEADLE